MLKWVLLLASLWIVPRECAALAIVRVIPSSSQVELNAPFFVEIRADFSSDILGFGLDLRASPSIAVEQGSPVIGPEWLSVPAADGDDLAGIAFPLAVSGEDVLLATVWMVASSTGSVELIASVSPGDQGEGFALDPSGFDTALFESGFVSVPEPSGLLLVALALAIFVRASTCRYGAAGDSH